MSARNFRCEKCSAAFTRERDLTRHLNRVRPCDPIIDPDKSGKKSALPFQCRFCNRGYAHAAGLSRHTKQCKIATSPGGMEQLYEHVLKKKEQKIHDLEQTVQSLSARLQDSKALEKKAAHPGAISVGVAITGNNNQIAIDQSTKTININVFGHEDTSHITGGSILKLFDNITGKTGELKELLPAAQAAIVQATMLLFSGRPENLTCYLPNKKTDDVLVHAEGGWEIQPYETVVAPMAARAMNLLFDKQPFPGMDGVSPDADIERCGKVLRYLADNENILTSRPPPGMRPILIRNKDALARHFSKLPVAGTK